MFRHRCNNLKYIAAIGMGTLIAFYCPTKVLIILLALCVVVLGMSIPKCWHGGIIMRIVVVKSPKALRGILRMFFGIRKEQVE